LKRDHLSRPRNPLIAEVFYRRGLIERWGRGTQKIVELCLAAGRPEPEFEEPAGAVTVRFLPSGYHPPLRVSHNLTERQRRIPLLLSDGKTYALPDVFKTFPDPLPERTIRPDLPLLRDLELVESLGRGRSARWSLKRPSDEGA
ncbi:MAG TPA: ATP-binding protein, partial [Armatimonadota bacterium]|nr:ATP-binding protein [Armatimonadota bacterium]